MTLIRLGAYDSITVKVVRSKIKLCWRKLKLLRETKSGT